MSFLAIGIVPDIVSLKANQRQNFLSNAITGGFYQLKKSYDLFFKNKKRDPLFSE